VFLPADVATDSILFALELCAFTRRNFTVRFYSAFGSPDMSLFSPQPFCFRPCYFTGRNSLADTCSLDLLTLIHHRSALRFNQSGHHDQHQKSQQDYLFHIIFSVYSNALTALNRKGLMKKIEKIKCIVSAAETAR
jgi:hypothetical protein